jgi:pimeloyl-ACP methyl ester carboxylesterase
MFASLEDFMKHIALFGLLSLSLACGGTVEQPREPAAPVSGPGTIAASDGVSIAYTLSGKGSPALVFIHGWLCDQGFWSAQVEEFSQTNTLLTIDLPGHGLSGMDRDDWPLLAFGGDVQTIVKHLDLDDIVLIGHSMGGSTALEAARLMPDRTIGVIAIDSLHDADAKYDPDQFNTVLAAYEKDFAGTCKQFTTSMFLESADPELVERVTSDMCDGSPEIAIALLREYFNYELGPALAAVDVPVRYLNADMWPTNVEVNRTYQPNFDGVIMGGVGHFLMMEEPDGVNRLLGQTVAALEPAQG